MAINWFKYSSPASFYSIALDVDLNGLLFLHAIDLFVLSFSNGSISWSLDFYIDRFVWNRSTFDLKVFYGIKYVSLFRDGPRSFSSTMPSWRVLLWNGLVYRLLRDVFLFPGVRTSSSHSSMIIGFMSNLVSFF